LGASVSGVPAAVANPVTGQLIAIGDATVQVIEASAIDKAMTSTP
jgi:hypothetical protein